jgi:hypothetical protein
MRCPLAAACLTALAAVVVMLTPASALAAAPDFGAVAVQPYEPRKPAPALALPDLDGRTVRLDDFRNKVVMLFFWTSW